MKTLLISLLLISCSGKEFTSEQGNDTSATGEMSEGGRMGGAGGEVSADGLGAGFSSSGALGGSSPATGGSGTSAMAGGPAMGGGGEPSGTAECLANWQNLDCARVCTNTPTDCQAVINCFVQNNSPDIDNCTEFTTVGISLAQSAERNCCHD